MLPVVWRFKVLKFEVWTAKTQRKPFRSNEGLRPDNEKWKVKNEMKRFKIWRFKVLKFEVWTAKTQRKPFRSNEGLCPDNEKWKGVTTKPAKRRTLNASHFWFMICPPECYAGGPAPPASPIVIPKEVRLRDLPCTSLPLWQKVIRSFIAGDSRPYRTVRSGGSRSCLPRNDEEEKEVLLKPA